MANRGNPQSSQVGTALVPVAPCNPQALAQLFSALQTFYAQCSAPATGSASIVELPQDCIPDTPPNNQERAGPSAASSSRAGHQGLGSSERRLTRSQSAAVQKAKAGAQKTKPSAQKDKAGAQKSKSKLPWSTWANSSQEVIGIPSVFQDPPAQHSPSEGSSSDEELPPQQAATTSNDPAPQESSKGKRKAKRKHVSKKSRRSDPSDSEDETGTSSSEGDSDAPMEMYWGEGEQTGAPLWMHERRANSHRKTFNGTLEWKDGALVEDVKVSTHLSTDFILGNHLSKRKRDKILNGDFIDMFTLLPPAEIKGKGEKKRYYGRALFAGDEAAISYNEDFGRNASLLSSTRWDQRDNNYWMEHVGPYIEKKTNNQAKSGKVDTKRRKQCWDFIKGACQCTACKYLHECDKCLGSHPAINCYKGKQQPFRGGRGHLHQGNRGAPSGASGTAQGTAGNRY
ncbi:XP_028590673.1uncharacterized protein LOC114599482 [Podarcis lilfordi]|uniref:XP_028590673.1uncharacterized protein LOC114599482 n=1 Tax=Podarcis lilfordi TaxID=74358 RepID=A0AA35K7N9_9SAUR|nr:XP_028590673.1uncharacterized protein LOC114599482 [Podarcis lilfordi]